MTDDDTGWLRLTIPWALWLAGGWIVLELIFRWGGVFLLESLVGSLVVADWLILLGGFPVIALGLTAIAVRAGSSPVEWGYEWSRTAFGTGLVAAIVGIAMMGITAEIDALLFGLDQAAAPAAEQLSDILERTPLLAILFLLGNGVIVPLTEEHVWRGIIQTDLVTKWGPSVGILVTAVAFTVKHVIVDFAIIRLSTLLALALLFGIVRHRYGTSSSMIVHIGVNLFSSGTVVYTVIS